MAYGNYALNEIKPPKGYVINQEPIPFEIAKGTFEQSPIQALEIVNKASTKDTTTSSDKMIPIEQSASPRNPNNSLSSEILGITPTTLKKYVATGEKISTWITILGLLLLFTIALIWKKRSGIK
ncbi:hypothetical protein RV04_GL001923 [Enterococcus hermanniensis]|uniref:SpaA-like prealbumin fold domain-containing protein n=1 Tax=Enterococcus hermanniensis TaxID=249189 RepID=A0A1L8TNG4_9ENTE|nr:hypothetical protein RV04_GL001923 [Enterococcus hermanniensis]